MKKKKGKTIRNSVNISVANYMRNVLLKRTSDSLSQCYNTVSDYVFSYVNGIIILSVNYNITKSINSKIIKEKYE